MPQLGSFFRPRRRSLPLLRSRVSDETVEMRRGDQWIAVTNLRMRTLLEGNPHVRVLFPVLVIQSDVVLELILCKDVLQYAVAVLSEEVDVYWGAEASGI